MLSPVTKNQIMKRIFNFGRLLVLTFVLLSVLACKNKHVNPSVEEMIVGTWNLSQIEADANANGKIDFGERIALGDESTVQFKLESNQKGNLLIENLDERLKELLQDEILDINDFNWELLQNKTQLIVNGEHMVSFQIVNITENNMRLHVTINDKSVDLELKKK